jgi:pimeloyl-ACP methyl ester carboxylesterase
MPTYERSGVSLAYEDRGKGYAAVVLLHGFTADRRMWNPVAEVLERKHRVLVPDLRGHGESDSPADRESYSLAGYAEDVAALLDAAGLERAHIAGSSFGGMIALEFAVTWPERLETLVVSDASPAHDRPEYDRRFREREDGIARMVDAIARFGPIEAGRRAAHGVGDDFLAEATRKRYARMNGDGIVGAAHARRNRRDVTGLLARQLTMPVLLCMGRDDPVYSALAVMAAELPHARKVTFNETGHGVPAQAPGRFIEALEAFYRDVATGRPVAGEVAL